jgi:hypothetical protein
MIMVAMRMRSMVAALLLAQVVFAGHALSADKADRFPVTDVGVEPTFGNMCTVQGKITNNSGKNYGMAVFKMSFFDANSKLMGTIDFILNDFTEDETATFEGISQKNLEGWKTFRVRLEANM